jgi:hypothetical protein
MEWGEIALILGGVVLSGVGWVIKSVVSDLKDLSDNHNTLREDHHRYKTHVAETYVEKADLHQQLQDIKQMIQRLFEKLDSK